MKHRLVAFLLSLLMIISLAACKGSKDAEKSGDSEPAFTSYENSSKITDADEAETKVTVKALEGNKYTLTIAGKGENQTIEVLGDRGAFLAQKLFFFDDVNFDGYNDILVVKSGFDEEGAPEKLTVLLYDSAAGKFSKAKSELATYKSVPASKALLVCESSYKATGKDAVYKFLEDGSLKALRAFEFGKSKENEYTAKIMDYSDEGTLLLYNARLSKSDYDKLDFEKLILVGLDGETVSLKDAIASVYAAAKLAKSSSFVDCEGIYMKDGNTYYRIRVDRSTSTSAYYSVNVADGTVELLQGSTQLI